MRVFRMQPNQPESEGAQRLPEATRDLLRANQLIAIGQLAGSIAHEINNPLEAIANLLYLMEQDKDLSTQSRSYLKLAEQELGRVIQISKQTLNFYRETPSPVTMQVSDLMEEVLVLYSRRLQEKQIQLHRRYHPQQKVALFPGEMRQVFANLVANAVEACPRGGGLWLRVHPTVMGNGQRGVRVTVADNGSGMDPALLRKIGRPFFTTKGQQGTGLGLWVTMSILSRNGSKLRVRSHTGAERHGTVFSILIPAEAATVSHQESMCHLPRWRVAS